jgi:hypothetical protein
MSTYKPVPRAVARERRRLKSDMSHLEQQLDAHRVASARMEQALKHIQTLALNGLEATASERWDEVLRITKRTLEAL